MVTERRSNVVYRCVWLVSWQALLATAVAVAASATTDNAQAKGKLPVVWDESFEGEAIDLQGSRLAFEEDFDEKELGGPKVFAPVHSPYGAGKFDGPNNRAYDVVDGKLRLTAYRREGEWRSGSVQTANADQSSGRAPISSGVGFACRDCYFETRMKFPNREMPGAWAAFWLLSPESQSGHTEIDILEWYGSSPGGHHHSVHIWPKDRKLHAGQSNYAKIPALADGDWHTYGAQMRQGTVHIYMDRQEVSRVEVPDGFDTSYYALVTLAVLKKESEAAQEPFSIEVDYIRAYEPGK